MTGDLVDLTPPEASLVAAAQAGNASARERLVDMFLPRVAAVARTYRAAPVTREELIQEGVAGLLTALERFDPERGTPLWAYASWYVREAMQQLVAELGRSVVLSDRALRCLAELKRVRQAHGQERRAEPGVADLAAATGLGEGQVLSLLAVDNPARSLHSPAQAGQDGPTLEQLVADESAQDAYDRADWSAHAAEVRRAVATLDPRERRILEARYGLDGPQSTLTEIAADLGVTAERVRQIEQKALVALREELHVEVASAA
jgi:RNA polymerase primary sigma factor